MPIINVDYDRPYVCLNSPTVMPQASAFLWNKHMMIQMSCRGYATAQFMQPEPAKYSHAPNMEATSFMQPEQPYYAHHPGRFFYVKDEQSKALFSAPYEPVRSNFDKFKFIVEHHKLSWVVEKNDVRLEICLSLCKDHPADYGQSN